MKLVEFAAWLLVVASASAAACGSSDNHSVARDRDGAGGEGGSDQPRDGGSTSSSQAGGSRSDDDNGSAAGAPSAGDGGFSGAGNQAGRGDAGAEAGEAPSGGAGGAPPDVDPMQPMVTGFGCFASSGDGWDFLEAGGPAILTENGTSRCGGQSISDNIDGFAPQVTPTSFRLTRRFVIDDAILAGGDFTLSFAADDAAAIVLNDQSIATCAPPSDNIGLCSANCQTSAIPAEAFVGDGQVNVLAIDLTNHLSVDAGGGNWGWTSMLYSICVAPKP